MTGTDWRPLTVATITDPAGAARTLIGLGLTRDVLWTALLLVAVLNALLFAVSNIALPPPPELSVLLPAPILYFVVVAAGLSLSVVSLHVFGRLLGGTGTLEDIMVLVGWIQLLRVAIQAVALFLALLAPVLSAMVVLAAVFYGIFIMLHFINQAHNFGSLMRSAGVLLISALAILLVLTFILSFVGGSFLEAYAHV
ncbi:YIP1 family protein [Pontibaca salina]|uniref:YIP1 family protein n=1 Tax=Pontibaca salina TaxID=2795731 RepID=A0A934LYW4_9RHOB|nr:YIP1 family protein [Pontibaca salina]MBI6628360.1 YIP1 family protein [Pontibaca salina]